MTFRGVAHTDVGKRRDRNEDNFVVDNELGLYIVCDGMGGHAAGEVASRMACETVAESVRNARGTDLVEIATAAVNDACRRVYDSARGSRERGGMGCTLTMLLCDGDRAVLAHVGDTRLYLWRDGSLHPLTQDHTMAAEMAELGVIPKDRVRTHHFAHALTRALGQQPAVQVDTLPVDLLPGDRFLICSDGLTNYVDDDGTELLDFLDGDLDTVPPALVGFANEAGGADNITVLFVEIGGDVADELDATHPSVQIEVLAATQLFEDDFVADLLQIVHVAEARAYDVGGTVIEQDDACGSLFVVLKGCLEISDSEGRSADLPRGSVFGETAILHPHPSRATVRAKETSSVLELNHGSRDALAKANAALWTGLLERLSIHLASQLDDLRAGRKETRPRV